MTVLLNNDSKIVVQGITGYQGKFHSKAMLNYGSNIVAGVTPGKAGEFIHGIPVFDTIQDAQMINEINSSIIFVPGPSVLSAAFEAMDAGIKLITIITEHVPIWDAAKIIERAEKESISIVGPNCPGLISPGIAKLGIIPGKICLPGHVGIVSRSGTLTYEIIQQLTKANLGQSTCIGMGGDPIHGIGFVEALQLFEDDPETHAIVLVGEIGGTDEEIAAEYISKYISKPVVAYIAGTSAPPGKQMGHAGAIISGNMGTAKSKIAAFEKNNIPIASKPNNIPVLINSLIDQS